MSEPEDLESRVSALEGQVEDLNTRVRRSEQDAAAARVLAGGADRDVADLGGEMREFRDQNNRMLNAMREDIVEVRGRVETGFAQVDARFARVDARFARVDDNFNRVDDNFTGIRGRLDAAAAGQERIVGLLNTLVERRDDPPVS
jgi:predicted  nucleic acid-binding Zn-ribbon protein